MLLLRRFPLETVSVVTQSCCHAVCFLLATLHANEPLSYLAPVAIVQVYFFVSAVRSGSESSIHLARAALQEYFSTDGASFTGDAQLLSYFALPNLAHPDTVPAFAALFTAEYVCLMCSRWVVLLLKLCCHRAPTVRSWFVFGLLRQVGAVPSQRR
jgi:hypothetical protein